MVYVPLQVSNKSLQCYCTKQGVVPLYTTCTVVTLLWEKWRTHKTLSWFAHTKVYSLQHFLSSHQEESMKTESTALTGQRETTGYNERDRGGRHRPWIIFQVFSCSSNLCFLTGWVLAVVRLGSSCSLRRRIPQPTLVFTSSRLATNSRLYLDTFCGNFISALLSRIHCLLAFLFEFLSANQNSFSICCWCVSTFNPSVLNYYIYIYIYISIV